MTCKFEFLPGATASDVVSWGATMAQVSKTNGLRKDTQRGSSDGLRNLGTGFLNTAAVSTTGRETETYFRKVVQLQSRKAFKELGRKATMSAK